MTIGLRPIWRNHDWLDGCNSPGDVGEVVKNIGIHLVSSRDPLWEEPMSVNHVVLPFSIEKIHAFFSQEKNGLISSSKKGICIPVERGDYALVLRKNQLPESSVTSEERVNGFLNRFNEEKCTSYALPSSSEIIVAYLLSLRNLKQCIYDEGARIICNDGYVVGIGEGSVWRKKWSEIKASHGVPSIYPVLRVFTKSKNENF